MVWRCIKFYGWGAGHSLDWQFHEAWVILRYLHHIKRGDPDKGSVPMAIEVIIVDEMVVLLFGLAKARVT